MKITQKSECRSQNEKRKPSFCILHSAFCILFLLTGCWKDDMGDDAHIKPMESSTFFADGKTARPLVAGTVPRGGQVVSDPIYAVTVPPAIEATEFPFPLTKADLERGQQQYNIYCAVCHGATEKGDGMIVMRGFPHPPSFYLDRLRKAPHGHFYNVITHGYGAMYSYGDRVTETEEDHRAGRLNADRWRIAGYIRALQLSDTTENGIADTPPAQRQSQKP